MCWVASEEFDAKTPRFFFVALGGFVQIGQNIKVLTILPVLYFNYE